MRSSSNPAFRNLPQGGTTTYGQYGQYGSPVGFNQPQGGVPGYGPGQVSSGADDRPMTVDDVVIKTGMSLGVALVTGVLAALWAQSQLAETGRLSVALIGVAFGAISGLFEFVYPGIALQAIIGTAGVFIAMLVVYKTGAVKVTPKLTKWIIGAMGGVLVLMLLNLITAVFFGFNPLRDGGPLAIVFSLVVIGIAAFSFLLDFDQADQMIRAGMPSKWAWYAAFGLMTTLVWLYLEILRLLSYLRD